MIGPTLRAMKQSKVRFAVIVLEIALTLAVGLNCGALILKSRREMNHPSGFDDAQLLRVLTDNFDAAFEADGFVHATRKHDRQVLEALDGVESVTNSRFLPWQGGGSSSVIVPVRPGGGQLRTQIYPADQGTLGTLGAELIEGRNFAPEEVEADIVRMQALQDSERKSDAAGQMLEPVMQDVIVSRKLMEAAFPGEPPIGKLFADEVGDQYRVIGVIGEFYNPYAWPEINERVMFFAGASAYSANSLWLVRAAPGRTTELVGKIQQALEASTAGRNVRVRTVDEEKSQYLGVQIITVALMSVLIGLLLLVTALGIAGVTSFSVSERTKQIGTRRALGARRRDILWQFLTESSLLSAMGIVIGLGLAFGLNLLLIEVLGAGGFDPILLIGAVVGIWLVALTSTYFPARRATDVPPVIATRSV
jgi:putative ABC transport system permease protein